MTDTLRVFVNTSVVDVPIGADVAAAVRVVDASLADRVVAGGATVTDARGLPVAPDTQLVAGAILRVVVSARRGSGADDEAGG